MLAQVTYILEAARGAMNVVVPVSYLSAFQGEKK